LKVWQLMGRRTRQTYATPAEIARVITSSAEFVRKDIEAGELRALRVGYRWHVPIDDAVAYCIDAGVELVELPDDWDRSGPKAVQAIANARRQAVIRRLQH
jgi:hypothetical protein